MIIYSVEISVKKDIHQEWVNWMRETHIPDVMQTNLFLEFKFFKNLNSKQLTYTIQYRLQNMKNYLKYIDRFADGLQKDHNQKFKNKFSAKREILTILD